MKLRAAPLSPGDTFGLLVFLREGEPYTWHDGTRSRTGVFICACGTETTLRIELVKSGNTRSCGCRKGKRTHEMSDTRIYSCWEAMKQRSTPGSSAQRDVPSYQGVSRDPRWNSFEAFYEDMGPTYFEGAVLARYKDQGDYTPNNCRWVTKADNNREKWGHQI